MDSYPGKSTGDFGRLCRVGIRKAFRRGVKKNKKGFYRCVNQKRKYPP